MLNNIYNRKSGNRFNRAEQQGQDRKLWICIQKLLPTNVLRFVFQNFLWTTGNVADESKKPSNTHQILLFYQTQKRAETTEERQVSKLVKHITSYRFTLTCMHRKSRWAFNKTIAEKSNLPAYLSLLLLSLWLLWFGCVYNSIYRIHTKYNNNLILFRYKVDESSADCFTPYT